MAGTQSEITDSFLQSGILEVSPPPDSPTSFSTTPLQYLKFKTTNQFPYRCPGGRGTPTYTRTGPGSFLLRFLAWNNTEFLQTCVQSGWGGWSWALREQTDEPHPSRDTRSSLPSLPLLLRSPIFPIFGYPPLLSELWL